MKALNENQLSEVIEMALSDHVRFVDIHRQYGLNESQVKALMRDNLKTGSYKAWRVRVRKFASRREFYK